MKKPTLKQWLINAREGATAQSTVPALLAGIMAIGTPGFNVWMALLGVIGVKCAHLAMNLIDDLYDYKADMLDDRLGAIRKGIKAYTAKYPYLTDGSATVGDLKKAIAAFGAVAVACGAGIFIFRTLQNGFCGPQGSWWIVAIAALTAFLGFFYSAPPIKFCYWGAGEAVTGLIFGPLLMLGMSYAAAGAIVGEIAILSIPVGLLVMNILYTHSFIDEGGDKESDKWTLAGLIRSTGWKLAVSAFLIFTPFVTAVIAVVFGWIHPAYLAVLIALPRGIWLMHSLVRFSKGEQSFSARPPKWLGPMGNWDELEKAGLGWYLGRWFTARNLLTLFCFLILIVKVILLIV